MSNENVTLGLAGAARAPFVGRSEEMAVLDEALEAVLQRGESRVVTIVGAHGLGKSRLVQEFILRARANDALVPRVYRGIARETDSSYGVFGRLLRMRFGLVEGMTGDALKDQVRTQVSKVVGDRKVGDVVYFLGQFLEVPFEESPLTRAVADDPVQGKLLRRAVFKSFLEADAQHSALCLVFEDLHLAHADSLELLRFLGQYLTGPILIVCTARLELLANVDEWAQPGEERHRLVELGALADDQAAGLVRALLAPCADDDGRVPEPLVDTALSYAGGSPLLIEQMLRLYHDRGVLEEETVLTDEPRWRAHLDRLADAELPLTVEDAIGARVMSLAPGERRVLELASTMGSVFWTSGLVPLLRVGAEAPEIWESSASGELARVRTMLAELEQRDFVLRLPDSVLPGSDEYVFKHNKEREAIHARLAPSAQKRCHAVFADWLDRQPHTRSSEETIAALADHRERAGDRHGAGLAYLEAGDAARASYAARTACTYYERGLELLGDSDVARRIDALHNFGDVQYLVGDIDDALASFREMLELAWRLDLQSKGGAAHNRIGRLYRDTGSLDEAGQHLEAAMALFERAGDVRGVASSVDDIGKLQWLKGDYAAALVSLRDGLVRRRRLGDRRSIALSLNNLAIVLAETGDFAQAVETWKHALGIRREIGDLVGVVQTLNNLGTVYQDRDEHPSALPLFEEALDVAKQIGDRNRIALVLTNVGSTLHALGRPDRAIDVLKQAEEQFDELGDKLGLADALRAMGEAHLAHGDLVRARDCIGRCVDIFATVRSKVQLGAALRTLGEITAAGGWGPTNTKGAREYFARSASIFEQTGNEVELAKTFTAYAKFLRTEEEFARDPACLADATRMDERATAIRARLREGAIATRIEIPPASDRS